MATEKRLVYADALKANFVVSGEFAKDLWHSCTVRSAIDNAPTVDAVEIPCRIGDIVWGIRKYNRGRKVKQGIVTQMYFCEDMKLCICVTGACRGEWGKTIFATKEEADAMLAKMEEGESDGN